MLITRKPKPTAIGCHIYAGGFTLGIREHFKVLAHLEEGPFGVETAKKNMPDLGVLYPESNWGPVTDYARDQFDLLYGNPPCASWSQAGVKVRDKEDRNEARWSKDGRTDCTVRLFALLEKLRPKIFLWESVAAAMKNGAAFVQQRVEQVNKLGYHAWLITFNGADCGLPQRRKRFFFLASKVKVDVEGPPGGGIVTVREALASIPAGSSQEGAVPSDNYLRILKAMKPGETSLNETFERLNAGKEYERNAHGMVAGRPGFLNIRLQMDELSPTITGGPQFFHPTHHRPLTVKEQQVMCGYPHDYEFVGGVNDKYAQIAKAVLPPAARWIGGVAASAIRSNRKLASPIGSTICDFLS